MQAITSGISAFADNPIMLITPLLCSGQEEYEVSNAVRLEDSIAASHNKFLSRLSFFISV